MEVRKVMRADHRQGGGVGGCSSGVVCENDLVGSEFSEGMRTHTLLKYALGKPLEAKLLKEFCRKFGVPGGPNLKRKISKRPSFRRETKIL